MHTQTGGSESEWPDARIHTVEYAEFVASKIEGYVTKFAPHTALKLIAAGKLTFD